MRRDVQPTVHVPAFKLATLHTAFRIQLRCGKAGLAFFDGVMCSMCSQLCLSAAGAESS